MPLNLPTSPPGNFLPPLRYAAQIPAWPTRDAEIDPTGVWDLGDVTTGSMLFERGMPPFYLWDLPDGTERKPPGMPRPNGAAASANSSAAPAKRSSRSRAGTLGLSTPDGDSDKLDDEIPF
jgi:hypothetical protein